MLEPQGPEFSLVGYGASRQKWKQESILYEKRRIFITYAKVMAFS